MSLSTARSVSGSRSGRPNGSDGDFAEEKEFNGMNLTYLKYAVEVEKSGSITGAAQNLYMGQPNLSKAIKDLENEIGITLFKRTAKGVIPTRQGVRFLAYAKNILAQMDELESLYKPAEQTDRFEFGVSVSRATYFSSALIDFLNRLELPRMSVHFREESSIDVFNDLKSGVSGFGIVRYEMSQEDYFEYLLKEYNLESRTLRQFTKRLLMSKTHPLAEYEDIPFALLSGFTEIIHGDFELPSLNSDKEELREMHPTDKRIYIYERGSLFALLGHVPGTFLWTSPIAPDLLEEYGLVIKDCSEVRYRAKDVLLYDKNHEFSAEEQMYLDAVTEQYSEYFPVDDKLFFKK